MMYSIDKAEETNFIEHIKIINQNSNKISLRFKSISDINIFLKAVIVWIADNFTNNKIYVSHDGNHPYSFVINAHKITINITDFSITAEILQSSKKNINCHHTDFWTTCGPTVFCNTKNSIVKFGYVGTEMYLPLFFNNYEIYHELMSDILGKVVEEWHYVKEKNMWIIMNDLYVLDYDEPTEIAIRGEIADDIQFLVFKALVGVVLHDHSNHIIAYEYITGVAPGHFRIANPYDYDESEEFLTVCDYIIKDNKLLVIPTQAKSMGTHMIWQEYGPRLYKQCNSFP